MGNPISHSRSPQIHQLFAQQCGERIDYSAILVDLGGFAQAVGNFHASGGRGLNVTVPFKEEAFALADTLTPRARLAGAVNTLLLHDNHAIEGDNSDGVGLVTDLQQNQQQTLAGKRILILGAGGAVRGVLGPILEQQPLHITLANRTPSRAEALAEQFQPHGSINGGGYEALNRVAPFEIIINGTSASLAGELPPLPDSLLTGQSFCYDMMYSAEPTPFMRWAAERGVQSSDGLGMLVEQAAESFWRWRQKRPQTKAVIEQIHSM
ncbi:shikimate dehydrogenase [Ectothiorhodospiraceae bacterium BW-2]|nr:shikimate dehydrogenase [Ectothiorhodospiraceae bacterium BW-2]